MGLVIVVLESERSVGGFGLIEFYFPFFSPSGHFVHRILLVIDCYVLLIADGN